MTFMKPKYLLQILSFFLIFSLTLTLICPVHATDTVDSLEDSASELQEELSGLQNELAQLGDEISSITEQLLAITSEIKQTKAELALAKGQEEVQYAAMKQRIRYMYENGATSFWEILFTSVSLADFLRRAELFSAISEYDNAQLQKLIDTQESIAAKETALAQKQEELHTLQDSLNKKEETLTQKISNTSSELDTLNAQLEAARKEAEKAQEELNQEVKPVIPTEPKPDTTPEAPPAQDNKPNTETPPTQNDKPNTETPPAQNDKPSSDVPPAQNDKPDNGSEGSSGNNNNNSDNSDSNITDTASDLELFAALIECEAGSRDYEGMLAVASVVVNRMNHPRYPDTLRGVIFQAGQFTPAHNGSLERVLKRGIKNSCLQAAQDALAGKNNIGDCLSFRSEGSGHVGIVIGGNVFF